MGNEVAIMAEGGKATRKVSVIIPTYNNGRYVADAVESALAQTYPLLEVIVVDDGSSDDTEEVLRPYRGRIRYVFQENGGPSAARNTGIHEARGDVIAFLDADDRWLPEKITKQLDKLEQDSAVGLVGCGLSLIDEKGDVLQTILRRNYASRSAFLEDLAVQNIVGGGSVPLVRKECFQRVGLFDKGIIGSEDWDMWLRIAWHYKVVFVEEPLVQYMVRGNSLSSSAYTEKMLVNDLAVISKHFKNHGQSLSIYLRQKAISSRYRSAALSHRDAGEQGRARYWIIRSFLANPFAFLSSPINIRAFVRMMIGRERP